MKLNEILFPFIVACYLFCFVVRFRMISDRICLPEASHFESSM